MPRLVKGAKWTYGWVVVSAKYDLIIPPQAWIEFGFQAGGKAVFLPGSSQSGGFSLSTPVLMKRMSNRLNGALPDPLAIGRFGDGGVRVPSQVGVHPGDRLLTARGSRYGLGFIAKGSIYTEALSHPELELFEVELQEDIES